MPTAYKQPLIKLFVDGKEIKEPMRQYVTAIEVSEALDQIDIIEARFTVPPTAAIRADVLKLAKHGVKMKAQMCADGSPARTLEGLLVEIGYSGGGNKGLELVLRGLSDLTKVRNSSLSFVHKGNDAAVVKKIATAAGLSANAQGVDGAAEFQFQPNITNAEAVQQIAKRNNYVFRVDEGKLAFSRVTKAGGGVKLKIPWTDVTNFTVTQSLDGIVTDVTVTGKDLKANKWLKGQAKAADISKISGGKSGVELAKKAFGKVEYLIDHTDDADQSQLVAVAKGELQRRAEKFVQGEFTCQFSAQARSGAQVEIVEPMHFSMKGPFIVREVTQLWDTSEGYRSRLSFFSDSLPVDGAGAGAGAGGAAGAIGAVSAAVAAAGGAIAAAAKSSNLMATLAKFKAANLNPFGESGYYKLIEGAEKCTFELLDQEVKGVKLLAQFNPSKLTITRGAATWNAGGGTGNVPALQYKGAATDTLAVDLLFDATEVKGKEADGGGSIMKLIKSYHALTLRYKFSTPKEPPRPPVLKFSWGADGLVFAGVIKDMAYDITMFNKKGHPMRATVKITMQGEFMPKSPDPSKILAPSAEPESASNAKSSTKDGADPMKVLSN